MPRPIRRAVIVLAALLTATAASSGPAAGAARSASGTAADTMAIQQFAADSGDRCAYGVTEGTIEWSPVTAPPSTGSVALSGTLLDRPYPLDPGAICPDDQRYTIATYSAYNRGILVDQEIHRLDNELRRIRILLTSGVVIPSRIDQVVIQVCRTSLLGPTPRPDYCGKAQTYLRVVDGRLDTGR